MYIKAVSFLLIGILGISINDTIIKFLSDAYALHQLVFIRGTFALLIIVPLVLLRQGIAVLRTTRPGVHALRGFLIVLANLTFFAGIASLPLAEASAVIFVSPVLITIFSHYFLGETDRCMALERGCHWAHRNDLCCTAFWCTVGGGFPVATCRGCLLRGVYCYNPILGAD